MATLDEDSADDDELSSEFASELSLETELSELASLDEPASPAGRLLELADSELDEDEAVSELELACLAAVSDEDWSELASLEDDDSALDELDSELSLEVELVCSELTCPAEVSDEELVRIEKVFSEYFSELTDN